jgi:hypothetical protein
MKKKMLLVAVGDYQGYAERLYAPVPELKRWEKLLASDPYGFELLGGRPPLIDATATRKNILDGLEELLCGAQTDDQLVFVILCHGSIAEAEDRERTNYQSLIAYPEGNPDLDAASITYGNLRDLLDKHTAGTDITVVIGACFADGVHTEKVKPLFVPPSAEVMEGDRALARFSDLASIRERKGEGGDVVFVTASRRDQPAYEISETKDRYRLVFCMRALAELRQNQDSFNELITNINPLRKDYDQEAQVYGSAQRLLERFPGEPKKQRTSLMADANEQSLRMRILGMGCFIKPKDDSLFSSRIVLPTDTKGSGGMKHFAFVEVCEEDVSFTGNLRPTPYYRRGARLLRWTLTEHRVWLYNPGGSGDFSTTALFDYHVPGMPDVCPELTDPRAACYDDYPVPKWFSGFIDLASGSADIGCLEKFETIFTRQYGEAKTWGPRKTPLSVVVTQPFVGDRAILLISDIAGKTTAQIFIKPGATILAGNAREEDITGSGSGENPREHFLIFYNLACPYPDNPGLPAKAQLPVNACTPVKWP